MPALAVPENRFSPLRKTLSGSILIVMKSWIPLLALLLFISFPAYAKKEDKGVRTALKAPTGAQPYPHQWFESKTQKGTSVYGQVYRPREDLVVLEMIPEWEKKPSKPAAKMGSQPEAAKEAPVIKAVRLKTASGKIYEAKIRRVPSWFMPEARQNYQSPGRNVEVPLPQAGEKKAA